MLKKLFALAVALCLTSCATIFNRKEYKLKVFSYDADIKAEINDSIYSLPAVVKVKRSKKDLKVTLITDSIRKGFTVKASPNAQLIYGNFLFSIGYPGAFAIDMTTQKRFTYGKRIRLDKDATDSIIEPPILKSWNDFFDKEYTTPKNTWAFTVSIPYANQFYQQPRNENAKSGFGFFGIAAGLEYYYKNDRFAKISVAAPIDFDLPFPPPLDKFDSYEVMRASNFSFTNNHKLNRLSLGYGLNYTIHTWQVVNSDWEFPSNDEEPRKKQSHSFGLTANTYFQFSDHWSVGLVYSPTFYNTFPESGFSYQHTISLDFQYRLPFRF
ncbi:hypothetical protein [uncultured Flavobacterium sp.]|uniref:hypothetical protein n=1 Tax=uncultured Flavobacterium sp. TaxID=165435 RepID=UPI0025D702DB|nr:hypothetical protein [uncultured Flavobacterium sp.]